MKILHVADTHIGYSAYNKLDENGYNQREMDVYSALSQVVDRALKLEPDLLLHSGDLFDSVRPSNRAISFVMEQLLRLSEAGIPAVIISGNHSTPKLRETGSVFRVFEHIKNLHLAYAGKYEAFEFGDLKVHALPHCMDKEIFNSELNSVKPDKNFGKNIMLHAGISGMSVFRMNEFNEQLAATGQLERGFDYVALGHYHKHCEVSDKIVYAGSTERLGFGEAGQDKGFVMLDLETGRWEFEKLESRKMLDFQPIDCSGMSAIEIASTVKSALDSEDIAGAIVRQRLENVARGEYNALDISGIRRLASESLYFELRAGVQDIGEKVASGSAVFDTLEKEFSEFLARQPLVGINRKALEKKGLEYIGQASGGEP
jgi:exonuclease SbcD